ncbi:MAG: carbamoyltransferase HypF, partial [Candidatus Marinimicrobia bacterium]|nr:carbamoyltransferase HypF [Candidatus Neomarinimicrobiota bacterium]
KSDFGRDKPGIAYDFYLKSYNNGFFIEWKSMIKQLVEDVKNRVRINDVSVKFHNGLAKILFKAVKRVREMTEINDVVLSGGVFMNIYLLTLLHNLLENSGFTVYTHRQVPANDGGIALGQAVIASAKRKVKSET